MRIGSLLFCLLFSVCLIGQDIAPDWTADDLDGVEHNLQTYLDDGKHVIIDWSATWCPPCWNYHNTGILETMHELYGPDGTDEVVVFFLEPDFDTNTNCLYGSAGCNDSSMGDWVTGTPYPIINLSSSNGGNMGGQYGVSAYPTITVISAETNQYWNLVGGQSQSVLESWVFDSFSMEVDMGATTLTDALCGGNGAIDLVTNGGYLSKTYEWSNGAGNTANPMDMLPGDHTVTVTDAHNYSVEATFTLTGPPNGPLEVDLVGDADVTCYGASNGALVVNAYGGNGGYSFDWSNGASGSYQDNLPGGTYTVTITDIEGCDLIEEYEVFEPSELIIDSDASDASCANDDGSVTVTSFGGVIPHEYTLNGETNNNGVFTELEAGTYQLMVTDDSGCEVMETITVEGTEGPAAEAIGDEVITCANTTVEVSGEGSTTGDYITYLWTTEDGDIIEGADELTALVSSAGTYILNVTDNSTNCVTTAEVEITADEVAPEAMVEEPSMLSCNTTSLTLSGEGSSTGDDFTYAWTTEDGNIVDGADGLTPNIDAVGTYTLTVMNTTNGCTSSMDATVDIDDTLPTVTTEDAQLTCVTTMVTICADIEDGSSAVWTVAGTEVAGNCADVDAAGTYSVEVTGSNGCKATAEATVTASADLPQVDVMEPDMITCTVTEVTITATVDGNVEDYEITWTDAMGTAIGSDLDVTVSMAGTYEVSVVKTANGCTTVTSVDVNENIINPESAYELENDNGSLAIGSSAMGNPQSYEWTVDGNVVSTEEMLDISFDANGTYNICLTVTNDCGSDTHCEDYYYATPLEFADVRADVMCYASNDGSITVTPSGGEGNYEITWSGPNGFNSDQLTVTDLAPGTYDMDLSDSYGYMQSGTYDISEPSEIEQGSTIITNESASGASDGGVSLTVFGGTGDFTFAWSDGSTGSSLSNVPAGEYTVDVTDENGCTKTFGPFVIASSTSVADVSFLTDLALYPVPASDRVTLDMTLESSIATTVRVLDAYGKTISIDRLASSKNIIHTVDVSAFTPGLYFMEITDGKESTTERFLVIR